jgi:hypothetical protein
MQPFLANLRLFPTAAIGSLPRPAWLLDVLNDPSQPFQLYCVWNNQSKKDPSPTRLAKIMA